MNTDKIYAKQLANEYALKDTSKLIVRQPLEATKTTEKFDIVCTVAGGGFTGQAGANPSRHLPCPAAG